MDEWMYRCANCEKYDLEREQYGDFDFLRNIAKSQEDTLINLIKSRDEGNEEGYGA